MLIFVVNLCETQHFKINNKSPKANSRKFFLENQPLVLRPFQEVLGNPCRLLLTWFSPWTCPASEMDVHTEMTRVRTFSCSGEFRGGGRRGGGGADAPLQGFHPLPTQRVPPLMLFHKSIFGRTTLRFF